MRAGPDLLILTKNQTFQKNGYLKISVWKKIFFRCLKNTLKSLFFGCRQTSKQYFKYKNFVIFLQSLQNSTEKIFDFIIFLIPLFWQFWPNFRNSGPLCSVIISRIYYDYINAKVLEFGSSAFFRIFYQINQLDQVTIASQKGWMGLVRASENLATKRYWCNGIEGLKEPPDFGVQSYA